MKSYASKRVILALSNCEQNEDIVTCMTQNFDAYRVKTAEEAADLILTDECKLLIFDVDFDGYDWISFFKSEKAASVLLSKRMILIDNHFTAGDYEKQSKFISAGVSLYVVYPLYDLGVMIHYVNYLLAAVNEHDRLMRNYDKLLLESMQAIVKTIDAKDIYTRGHSIRVGRYSAALAKALGLSEKQVSDMFMIGLLHDVGKIGVPDYILNKPDKLTAEEFDIIKKHTVIGRDILKEMPIVDHLAEGAYHHHEHYDGSGYPKGLKGEEIPFVARILAVADAYDAMNSDRVYRSRLSKDVIKRELINCRGTQFDPLMADTMIKIMDTEIKEIDDDFISEKYYDTQGIDAVK